MAQDDDEEDGNTPGARKAVALQYKHGVDAAPRVTAKGKGEVAERIIALAREHGVAIEGNASLAEALSHVEVDQQIPPELYRAVAEVIGFVLKLSGPPRRPAR